MIKTQYGFILKFWVNISRVYSLIFEDSGTKVMFFLKTKEKNESFSEKIPLIYLVNGKCLFSLFAYLVYSTCLFVALFRF